MRYQRGLIPTLALGLGVAALLAGVSAPAAAQSALAMADQPSNDVALQPGDMLRLKIWREPDLSGDFLVDEHGQATLPRLGETTVTGISTDQLKSQLTDAYREYLNNPSIEITPLRRISVVGAVRNPGVYRIDPSVTLGAAVNVAGGPDNQAKRNVIELRRGATHQRVDLGHHPELATLPLQSNDQIYIPERSWLSQNATWFVSTLVAIGGTTAYLVTR